MLKRLKIKIIAVVLGTLLIVFAAVLLVLNLSVYQTSEKRTAEFMATVVENDGFLFAPRDKPAPWRDGRRGPPGGSELMREGRFFYARIDPDGEVFDLNLEMMFDFSADDARDFVASVYALKRTKGSIGNFSYLSADKPYGQILVFAERGIEISLLMHLTRMSLWVAGIAGLVLACLSAFFTRWMVGPIQAAFDRQRRFVSDASHELKTPLTIISANVDVLHHEIGENTRLRAIQAQSDRMSGLIHSLLTLARADERMDEVTLSAFDISAAVLSTVLEFESRAFEEKKEYAYAIDEGIAYTGDEKQIRQLIVILIDNAIQHSAQNGRIDVSLRAEGNRPRISVYNTGVGVSDSEYEKIFERFYRSDDSRSRETGGYGVGLSIAKAIVAAHRGRISVSGEYGKWIRFDIAL